MVVIGVDAHKRTHTLAVVDEVGRKLANRTFPATSSSHSPARGRPHQSGGTGGPGPGQVDGHGPANRP